MALKQRSLALGLLLIWTWSHIVPGTILADDKFFSKKVMEHILEDAIGKAIEEGIKEAIEKFELRDPVELQLFKIVMESKDDDLASPSELSITFIRKRTPPNEPKQVKIHNPDTQSTFSMTKITADISEPLAIVTIIGMAEESIKTRTRVMVYRKDKWHNRPTTLVESRLGDVPDAEQAKKDLQ